MRIQTCVFRISILFFIDSYTTDLFLFFHSFPEIILTIFLPFYNPDIVILVHGLWFCPLNSLFLKMYFSALLSISRVYLFQGSFKKVTSFVKSTKTDFLKIRKNLPLICMITRHLADL